MRAAAFFLLLCGAAVDPRPAPWRALGQSTAIEKQLASIERQKAATQPARSSFFTAPWSWSLIPSGEDVGQLSAAQADCLPIPPAEIDAFIEETAKKEGYTPDLLRAVIQRESAYLPCAVSTKGAQGLMQLMPETAADMGVTDPFDPHANIAGGARYLGALLDRYKGDVSLALAAYNAGPGRVDQYSGLPPIPETINYVRDILSTVETH